MGKIESYLQFVLNWRLAFLLVRLLYLAVSEAVPEFMNVRDCRCVIHFELPIEKKYRSEISPWGRLRTVKFFM